MEEKSQLGFSAHIVFLGGSVFAGFFFLCLTHLSVNSDTYRRKAAGELGAVESMAVTEWVRAMTRDWLNCNPHDPGTLHVSSPAVFDSATRGAENGAVGLNLQWSFQLIIRVSLHSMYLCR